MGVELEGGWNRDIDPDCVYHDGSVKIFGARISGEVSASFTSFPQIRNWLKVWYPDYVNSTCGLHVHISTRNKLMYMKLLTRKFQRAVTRAYIFWGEKNVPDHSDRFWLRLINGTRFCQTKFKPHKQIHEYEKYHTHRYTQLNFCYPLHGTFEYRALPMFESKEMAFNAIKVMIDTTTSFLADNYEQKETKHRFKLEIDEEQLTTKNNQIIEQTQTNHYCDTDDRYRVIGRVL